MIGKHSRYRQCIHYRDPAGDFLGMRTLIDTTPRCDDRFHTVTAGDRIDRLADQYLGDAQLWWIICDYNAIFFPLELPVGGMLRIPSYEHVQMNLLD